MREDKDNVVIVVWNKVKISRDKKRDLTRIQQGQIYATSVTTSVTLESHEPGKNPRPLDAGGNGNGICNLGSGGYVTDRH
jgi:hypothetical protein